MDQAYPYTRQYAYQYTFVSDGKERIEKVVIFSSTPIPNLFNMGFGDISSHGSVDDRSNSNSGDLVKVLSTVIQILKDFLHEQQNAKVAFIGSTSIRTSLYERIIRNHYQRFSKEFIVSTLILENGLYREVLFNPASHFQYLSFYIKLKIVTL